MDEIRCPGCGEGYLHLDKTTLFHRRQEDGEARKVIVDRHGVTTDSTDSAPGRRDSLVVEAFCEHCDEWGKKGSNTLIEIREHKGFLLFSVTRRP